LKDANGKFVNSFFLPLDLRYHNSFTTYTAEVNQIFEAESNTLIFGGRYQSGDFHTSDQIDNPPASTSAFFMTPPAAQDFNTSLERISLYAYDTWRPFRTLSIEGGVAYDHLQYPTDYRNPPILDSESSRDHVSPKAGVIWNPTGHLYVRAAYTRALSGVSFDQSIGLEPNQVAGFNQVFRSIISESVVGSVAAPTYENAGILIEDRFPTGTYAGIQATFLKSDVDRRLGVFDATLNSSGTQIIPPILPSSTPELLKYEEENLSLTLNQLVGNEWSFGASYQIAFSDLQTISKDVPASVSPALADSRQKATLHQAQMFALYNHPCGLFGRVESYWAQQSNVGYAPDIPGDEIWQLNAYIGYRLRRNFGDVTIGLLNITDQDYKLNPLNYYNELPRNRTLVARVRLNF
jgi:outer membrane receptor protein involved in Fe transport